MSADARLAVPCELDEAELAALADAVLDAVEHSDAELSVLVTSDAHVAELNAAWRGVAGPTDVLSFPQEIVPGAPRVLGDVVVALETATSQAADQGHALRTELQVLLVHGVLHLLGHDHETDGERAVMEAEERRVLARLGEEPGASLVGRASEG